MIKWIVANNELKIISGNGNHALAGKIAASLGTNLTDVTCRQFSDKEIHLQINENVRGCNVFLVQPTCYPANDNIMELLLLIDAARRASASSITAVLPYFGYARQDRKDRPRVPISAALVANTIENAGADRVLVMDLHAPQIQGFFKIPVDHLYGAPILAERFTRMNIPNVTVVSPDVGGTERARRFAAIIGAPLAIIDKYRPEPNSCEIMHIIGDVKGRNCIMVDDLVDTAKTLTKGAQALVDAGALAVWATATHGVLSGAAIELIEKSVLQEVVIADTIPADLSASTRIVTVPSSQIFSQAIFSVHNETSVSKLF